MSNPTRVKVTFSQVRPDNVETNTEYNINIPGDMEVVGTAYAKQAQDLTADLYSKLDGVFSVLSLVNDPVAAKAKLAELKTAIASVDVDIL